MQYFLYSIITGLLIGLSWPTKGNTYFLFFGFCPLLYIIEELIQKKYKKYFIFLNCYISFIIWNGISVWWLHYARKIDGSYAWEAYIFPILLNSFLMSIIFLIYIISNKYLTLYIRQIFLITLWLSFEKLHLEWEIAWPWLNLGNGLSTYHQWIQWYEYTGILGGSLWIFIINIYIFNLLYYFFNNKNYTFFLYKLIILILIILIPIIISYFIYNNYKEIGSKSEVIILQPNINPYDTKYHILDKDIINDLIFLTKKKITNNTSFIIAPETAIPGNQKIYLYKLQQNKNINIIKNFLYKYCKSLFISGIEITYNHKLSNKIYNSVISVDSLNNIQIYFKSKFVPGVEIIPYKIILQPLIKKFLIKFGANINGLSTKTGIFLLKNLKTGLNIAPIICYESIFGEYVTKSIKKGANYISVHTNDAWWGLSEGHRQHLFYAKLRAIENRRYIARSANNGISAIINQKGDILSSISYNKKGVIRYNIISNNKQTFYTKNGDLIARISNIINMIIFIFILFQYIKYYYNIIIKF